MASLVILILDQPLSPQVKTHPRESFNRTACILTLGTAITFLYYNLFLVLSSMAHNMQSKHQVWMLMYVMGCAAGPKGTKVWVCVFTLLPCPVQKCTSVEVSWLIRSCCYFYFLFSLVLRGICKATCLNSLIYASRAANGAEGSEATALQAGFSTDQPLEGAIEERLQGRERFPLLKVPRSQSIRSSPRKEYGLGLHFCHAEDLPSTHCRFG